MEAPLLGSEPFCGISYSTVLEKFQRGVEQEKRKYWDDQQGMRQAKIILKTYKQNRFNELIALSKDNLRILTGILSGHCRLGISEAAECRFCEEEDETSIHILTEWVALRTSRALHLGTYEIEDGALTNIRSSHIVSFLKRTGLAKHQRSTTDLLGRIVLSAYYHIYTSLVA